MSNITYNIGIPPPPPQKTLEEEIGLGTPFGSKGYGTSLGGYGTRESTNCFISAEAGGMVKRDLMRIILVTIIPLFVLLVWYVINLFMTKGSAFMWAQESLLFVQWLTGIFISVFGIAVIYYYWFYNTRIKRC